MGDLKETSNEEMRHNPPVAPCDVPKPSIDILKEAKPSANIAIRHSIDNVEESAPRRNNETTLKASATVNLCEDKPETPRQPGDEVADAGSKGEEKVAMKYRSDIFALKEAGNETSTIFSVGGAPSKTIHRTTSGSSSKNSCSSETINSGVSKQGQLRNPLTGMGVSSNDEFRTKPSKRKGKLISLQNLNLTDTFQMAIRYLAWGTKRTMFRTLPRRREFHQEATPKDYGDWRITRLFKILV